MEDRFSRALLLIEKYLTQIFGNIRVYREENEFLIPWGSTVINVEVAEEEGEIYVHIYSPVVLRVKPDKDLLRFLLIENSSLKMCSFWVEFEDGFMDIIVGIKIKFDYLTKDSLANISINVGNVANEYSKEIIAVFGGLSFKEYVEREKAEKKASKEEKILHDIFRLDDLEIALELYRLKHEDSYLIVGKVVQTGQVFILAERKKDIGEVFRFLEELKNLMLRRDIARLRKVLKHYEFEDHILYSILAGKEKERIKRLKDVEREIQILTEMLIRGKISHEDYKRRISDIEKQIDL